MLTGFDANISNGTMWFSEGDHETTQNYIKDTNILRTTVKLANCRWRLFKQTLYSG